MHALRFAPGALALALASWPLAPAGAERPEPRVAERFERAARSPRFEGWSPLSDYVAAGLGEGGSFRLTLPTHAGRVELSLQPSAVHGRDYHGEESVRGGPRRGRALPKVRTFAGSVAREGGVLEPAARGGDFARLALEPGGKVSGLLRVDGVLYDLTADAAAGDLVVHVRELLPEEVADALSACGVSIDESLAGALEPGAGEAASEPATAAAGALREIELGTEADAAFVAQTGGVTAANAKILSIVNSINGIYEFDLGLTNRVVFQRAWNGSDPYTSTDSGTLLNEFRSSFLAEVSVTTDEAQLFSGRDFDGSFVGRAFIGSACTNSRFGVSQYYRQSDALTRLIVAHEMAHNLGGSHTTDGLMAPSIDPNVTWFSSTSQSQIASYLRRVSCLAPADTGGPPTLAPVGPQSVSENDTLALQLEASDPEGGTIRWSALPLPSGASFSNDGGFQWRPALATVGCSGFVERAVTFTATDSDGNQARETVVISVLDAPSGAAPQLADPEDRTLSAGQPLSIPLSASDPDGDSVTFSAASLPSGATLSAAGVFSWTPAPAQAGTHPLTFTATDCTGRSASAQVTLEVATSAPVLSALSAASGAKGELLTVTGLNLAGRKVKVFFGPKKAKAREVTATSLVVKVPKKPKAVGSQATLTVVRDGILSVNALPFTWLEPTP